MATSKVADKEAARNQELYQQISGGKWNKWREDSQKGWDFYLGDQLTKTEQQELTDAGMPDFILNKITQGVELLVYFLTANNPKWIAAGREGSDVDLAAVHTGVMEYCWDISHGKSVFGQAIRNALGKGIGYLCITVDKFADRGMGEVVFGTADPYDVYPDPGSTDIMFRDAAYILIRKVKKRGEWRIMLPDYESQVNSASSSASVDSFSNRNTDTSISIQPSDVQTNMFGISSFGGGKKDVDDEQLLDYYERYEKVRVPYVNITIRIEPTKEQMKAIMQKVDEVMAQEAQGVQMQVMDKQIELKDAIDRGDISQERAQFDLQSFQMSIQKNLEALKQSLIAEEVGKVAIQEDYAITKKEYDKIKGSEAFKGKIVNAVDYYETNVKVSCTLGNKDLYDYSLEIEDYPIIPIPYIHTGTPYPISAVMPVIGKQREVNKAHQLMIYNASLGSSVRWLGKMGSFYPTKEDWETSSTIPGVVLEYLGETPPIPVLPAQLSGAFLEITARGEQDIAENLGALPIMQGMNDTKQETYRGMLALDEFGTRRIRSWMHNVVEPALEQAGRIFTQMAQKIYQAHKIIRIVNPDTSEVKRQELNIPVYNDLGVAISKYFDYQSTRFDIKLVSGSTMPVNRWAVVDEYFKWYQANLIDDVAMLAETDIKNKEAVLKRKSLYAQLSSQVAQLEDELARQKGTNETLERELIQSGIKDKIRVADMEVSKAQSDHKARMATIEAESRTQAQLVVNKAAQELKGILKSKQSEGKPQPKK